MSSIRNPSVGVELTGEGFVAGYQGGRPPDGVIVVEDSTLLERQGSLVAPDVQPVQEKGRTMEEEMVIDDGTPDGERVADSWEGLVQTPPVPEENLHPTPLLSSFKDKLLGAFGASRKPSIITELDVEVKAEDEQCGGDKPAEGDKGEVTEKRNPTELYGPWMQVVNRHRRPGTSSMKNDRGVGAEPSRAVRGSHFAVLEEEGIDANEVSEAALVQNISAGKGVAVVRSEHLGGCEGVQAEVDQLPTSAHLITSRESGRVLFRGEASAPKENLVVAGDVSIADRGGAVQEKVASKGRVIPVPTSLAASKHSVI
ncbi:hypothetical protein V6N11_010534 [Hibiscus sabdariffa]|uniref:Uncharacterized protein n=1 Tax=Hibiscus sabdariffa TaxID=183260 RepID=A0ABR2S661_9ROSI